MKTEEMRNRLDKLTSDRFMIMMIDRWSDRDRAEYDRLTREINELKRGLESERG